MEYIYLAKSIDMKSFVITLFLQFFSIKYLNLFKAIKISKCNVRIKSRTTQYVKSLAISRLLIDVDICVWL